MPGAGGEQGEEGEQHQRRSAPRQAAGGGSTSITLLALIAHVRTAHVQTAGTRQPLLSRAEAFQDPVPRGEMQAARALPIPLPWALTPRSAAAERSKNPDVFYPYLV